MKLIVGLGNPGKEYENTRHNVGFMVIDYFLSKNNTEIKKEKYNGLYEELRLNNEKVIFLEPQKYMNLSGEVVRKFVDFYKINIEDILVIQDDLDQPLGKIKLKQNSSSGGHNGIKDIEKHLGTKNYKRLKIGISNNKSIDTKDFVLGKLSKDEKTIIDNSIKVCYDIITDFLSISFDELMNKYN